MPIIPSRTTRVMSFPGRCLWGTFRLLRIILVFPPTAVILSLVGLVLLVKYSAYLPDNPNYRRNYDATLTVPRNPFTEKPATIRQSELEREERRRETLKRESEERRR